MSARSARADRIQNVGDQECPRRAEAYGAPKFPLPDHWQMGTWASTQDEADTEVAEFMSQPGAAGGGIGNVLWLYPGAQPRTCSYCGGGHPDDLLALIRAGWEVEPTDKGYKRYLNPPGYREHMKQVLSHVRAVGSDYPQAQYPSPVPPVKLFVQHFSAEQIAQFNAALRMRRGQA